MNAPQMPQTLTERHYLFLGQPLSPKHHSLEPSLKSFGRWITTRHIHHASVTERGPALNPRSATVGSRKRVLFTGHSFSTLILTIHPLPNNRMERDAEYRAPHPSRWQRDYLEGR